MVRVRCFWVYGSWFVFTIKGRGQRGSDLETVQWDFDLLSASREQGLNRYKRPYMVACREIYFWHPNHEPKSEP